LHVDLSRIDSGVIHQGLQRFDKEPPGYRLSDVFQAEGKLRSASAPGSSTWLVSPTLARAHMAS